MKNKYLFYLVALLGFGLGDLIYLNSKVIPALWPDKTLKSKLASTEKRLEETDNPPFKIKPEEKERSSSGSFQQVDRLKESDKSKDAPLVASSNIDQINADVNPKTNENNSGSREEIISRKPTEVAIKDKTDNFQDEEKTTQPTMIMKIVVRFKYSEYELPPNYRKTLLSELEKVTLDENIFVTIDGHTDRRTTEKFDNQRLSQQRADNVAAFLKKRGILENQITAIGRGDTQPLDSNDTLEAYKKNRRAEIKIFKDKP